ncbi:MAG TPA: metal-dependent hydrolase [Flavobacteriales bacterium]|nr:metal-dependent hydrolase [Flavobacteriales bacterium]
MASIFSHAIAATALGTVRYPKKEVFKYFALGIFCASFPDMDIIMFKLGVPYEHPFGHRGFFHSIFFCYLQGLFIVRIFYHEHKFMSFQALITGFYFFCCGVSHGILDAMTNGGKGVAFFAPFNNTRYFLPWRPIQVSPVDVESFFGEWGMRVLHSELYYVMIPSFLLMLGMFAVRRFSKTV